MFLTLRKTSANPEVAKWARVKKLRGLKMSAVLNFPKNMRSPSRRE